MGFGLTLGPLLSSAVYGSLGYTNTFYFYAGFMAFFGLGSTLFMPNRLNERMTEDNSSGEDVENMGKITFGRDHSEDGMPQLAVIDEANEAVSEEVGVSYLDFFKQRRSLLSLAIGVTSHVLLLYNSPTLANVIHEHGLSKGDAGFGIAICWTMYAIGGFLGGPICQLMSRRYVFLFT